MTSFGIFRSLIDKPFVQRDFLRPHLKRLLVPTTCLQCDPQGNTKNCVSQFSPMTSDIVEPSRRFIDKRFHIARGPLFKEYSDPLVTLHRPRRKSQAIYHDHSGKDTLIDDLLEVFI